MPLPQPRHGELLRIKGRPVEFSFWPMERTTRRYGLGTRVFATDPWTVIRRSAERRCTAVGRLAAIGFLEQAEDFFRAAESGVKAAKPLLLYYCFMNLVKAFLLASRRREDVGSAQHGLSERLDAPPTNVELVNAYLEAFRTPPAGLNPPAGQRLNLFDEALIAVGGAALQEDHKRFDLLALLPQVVPGHRLWVEADGSRNSERFVAIEQIRVVQNVGTKEIWIRLQLFADDIRRVGLSVADVLSRSKLAPLFHAVHCDEIRDDRSLITLEQLGTVHYTHRPSDKVPELVETVKQLLWRTVLSTPPYRKYYIYPAPQAEHSQVLPQIVSIYAIAYYLGSIVRYRPHHFDKILAGTYGPFIEAFLNDQPQQFVYLLASEFAEKEVTKAAIV